MLPLEKLEGQTEIAPTGKQFGNADHWQCTKRKYLLDEDGATRLFTDPYSSLPPLMPTLAPPGKGKKGKMKAIQEQPIAGGSSRGSASSSGDISFNPGSSSSALSYNPNVLSHSRVSAALTETGSSYQNARGLLNDLIPTLEGPVQDTIAEIVSQGNMDTRDL